MKKINKNGFTLIEILFVVAIIMILATVILASTIQSKRNARINNAKTTLRNAIMVIVSCNDSNSPVNIPNGIETGDKVICSSFSRALWPKLQGDYSYVAGGDFSASCDFQINTNGDSSSNIRCTCVSGICN